MDRSEEPRTRSGVLRPRFLVPAVLAAIVLVYALGGFLLAPWLVGRELPRLVEEKLQHRASIGRIAFNPFTLSVHAAGLSLQNKTGRPVLGFGEATVSLSWSSIVRRAWVLSEIKLVDPTVHIEISRDGRLNLSALAWSRRGCRRRGERAGADSLLRRPRCVIANGVIDFEDAREGYRNRIEHLSLELAPLSNLDSDTGPFTLVGRTPDGAKLGWKGELSLSPLTASGTLDVRDAALPELNPYIDDFAQAKLAAGRADLELPYRFALAQGKPQLRIVGAKLGVRGLEVAARGSDSPIARLGGLALEGVDVDFQKLLATARSLRVSDGMLTVKRGVDGDLDVAGIFGEGTARKAAAGTAPASGSRWHAGITAVEVSSVSASYSDETAKTPLSVSLRGLTAKTKLDADSGDDGMRLRMGPGEFGFAELRAGAAGQAEPAVKITNISVSGVRFDGGSRSLDVDAARIGSLDVGATMEAGRISLLDLVPAGGKGASTKPFAARLKSVEIAGGNATFADRESGIAVALEHLGARLSGASSDASKPLEFELSAGVRSGGKIGVRGRAVPAAGTLEAKLQASGVALAPLQSLMARFAGAKLASGEASLAGTLTAAGKGKGPALNYTGSAGVVNVAIDDKSGARLIGWKSLATDSLRVALGPTHVEVDELRWVAPVGKLAIAADGTTNLGRAFARAASAPASKKDEATGEGPVAVSVRRIRIDDGQLDFSDDSVSPGFAARITELEGTANGLSSDRTTRGNFTLEGRVGEFGFAHLFGALNPFALRERTGFRVQFRNLDVATVSPYSMKFAGYRIASGRLSLDLDYRVNEGLLQGDNKITLDNFVLGERVESAGASNLPVELAIALLKDPDGRIDLEVPITGSLDDPQFSVSAIVWKAIGNIFRNIVAAPFRALSHLLGGRGEEVGAIAFEPGASRLLPPEREKLGRIVEALAKRPEVKLVIPARYDSVTDARALKRAALVREVGKRAGFAVADGEDPGPLSIEDRPTRSALRSLFAERFSSSELDKLKSEAEAKERGALATDAKKLSLLDKVRNFAAGEPQVADPRDFYLGLVRRLRDSQPLPEKALGGLAQARAAAIESALRSAGADPARMTVSKETSTSEAEADHVTIQLGLSAR